MSAESEAREDALDLLCEELERLVRANAPVDAAALARRFGVEEADVRGPLAALRVLGGALADEPAQPEDSVAERRFGRYVLQGELGRGGMGVVYRAYDSALDRTVALKQMLRGRCLFASPAKVERFRREAHAVARLEHPGVVKIYDVDVVDETPYFVMELVEGRTLSELLDQLSADEVVRLVIELARVLHHAHSKGLVHRDVKPQNIMVDAGGQPRLLDFGVVRDNWAQEELTLTGQILGTVDYMAPEQVEAKPGSVGPETDVYALGAVLYRSLCGQVPCEADSSVEALVAILKQEPRPPRELEPTVSAELEAVILRCLKKDPQDRFPSAAALAAALEGVQAGSDVHAAAAVADTADQSKRRPGRGSESKSPVSGRRRPAPSLAARAGWVVPALALLLAGGAWLAGQPAPIDEEEPRTVDTGGHEETPPARDTAPDADPVRPHERVDRTSPVVTILEPAESTVLTERGLRVRGTVSDTSPAETVTVDGVSVPLRSDGVFEVRLDLAGPEGSLPLTVVARDEAGNEGFAQTAVILDLTPPALEVTAPEREAVVGREVVLRGRVGDVTAVSLFVDGRPQDLSSQGTFEVRLRAEQGGAWGVVLEARDQTGKLTRITHPLICDLTPPALELDTPAEGQLTRAGTISVRGRIHDANPPQALVVRRAAGEATAGEQASEAVVKEDGSFSLDLTLEEGENTILVRGQDLAGNPASCERKVVRDSKAPGVSFAPDLPRERWGRRQRKIVVQGTVDEDGCQVTLNRVRAKMNGRSFEARIRLEEGENVLAAVAVDPAGNTGKAGAQVAYSTGRPGSQTPKVKGFTYLRKERFTCGGRTHTVAIYRCDAFAAALGLVGKGTDPACEFVLVPGGTFLMGSPDGEEGRTSSEGPQHEVRVDTFLLARTELTQRVWEQVLGANPSFFQGFPRRPVEQVTWDAAQAFLAKGRVPGLRLPSEAEWEYACRAGTTTRFSFGESLAPLGQYAVYERNSSATTQDVGQKKPNAFGLFDMHGNVSEWCQDTFHDGYAGAPRRGWPPWEAAASDGRRILRSAPYWGQDGTCRSAARKPLDPSRKISGSSGYGLRLARQLR